MTRPPTGSGVPSPRQLEVLAYFADGRLAEEVALEMRLSVHTIREHTRTARGRLDARNTTHAVALAMRAGLLK